MSASPRILVAGASGAIGRRLCRLLVEEGWTVSGTTRSTERAAALWDMGVEPVVADVFDARHWQQAVIDARPDIVIHQLTDLPPALDPARMAEARLRNARIRELGTQHLVAAAIAAGARRLIAQSVAFAYAPGPAPWHEEAPLNVAAPDPAGLSARGVASLEQQVRASGLESVVLRYGKLYGPGTGFDAPLPGGPVHVDAAADAARRAITQGSGIYNIAEADGTVASERAMAELGWSADFRLKD